MDGLAIHYHGLTDNLHKLMKEKFIPINTIEGMTFL